jgi:hypothetical protein
VTATRKTARSKKPEIKPTEAPKSAAAQLKKKEVARVKTAAAKPTTPNLGYPLNLPHPHSRKSLISSITFSSKHVWS